MKNTSWAFKNHFSTLSSPARRVLNPFHKQNEPQSRENSPKSDAFLMKINKVEVGDDKHELKKKKKKVFISVPKSSSLYFHPTAPDLKMKPEGTQNTHGQPEGKA